LAYRLNIRGISLKKFDASTSFAVALHEMLTLKRWARIETAKCMLNPPKKKKLQVKM